MKILVSPASMKGTLSAVEFSNAIEEGLRRSGHTEIGKIPIADGGDDTAIVLASALHANFISCEVQDPLDRSIQSGFYLNSDGVAIVEMALASGLKLLKTEEYSALNTTSFGTGQLIKSAIAHGAKKILIGVGGSATVDAGMGALMALGFRFYNSHHQLEKGTGATLGEVVRIDSSEIMETIKQVEILLLTDVRNPLLGINGAANVFAPQKGASPFDIKKLNKNLSLFAGSIFQKTGKDISGIEGGGAAGGLAAGLHALINAEIFNGAEFILNTVGFFEAATHCDAIVTGEGTIDSSTFSGKGTGAVLNYGTIIDKPVYAICGVLKMNDHNKFKAVLSLVDQNCSVNEAMNNSYENVVIKAMYLGNCLNSGQ